MPKETRFVIKILKRAGRGKGNMCLGIEGRVGGGGVALGGEEGCIKGEIYSWIEFIELLED